MAIVYNITWQPAGAGAPITLCDLLSAHAITVEQIGGQSMEEVVPMFQAANPQRLALGNVAGDLVFTDGYTYASRAAALNGAKTAYLYLNGVGTLILTVDTATMTFANAVCKGLRAAQIQGLRWVLRYTFGITTIT